MGTDRLGLCRVWASENTRELIFDAMERRETYATTGPRMLVRFFGGFDFTADDANTGPAVAGYTKGVPMGGDLTAAPEGKADLPGCRAEDPIGANLDRYQVVKGWLDAAGEVHEKSTTSPGQAIASRALTARCLPSAAQSTSPTRHGPTRSARRNWWRCGPTPISIKRSAPSITVALSKFRRRGGRPMMRNTSA